MKVKSEKPELLSPAGDLEKLETAVRFGADAVYVGAGSFSLRTQQTSFSFEDLAKGIKFAHQHKVKVYLAINIFAFDEDLKPMLDYLGQAVKLGIDAAIISDPGFIYIVRQKYPKLKIHLSTQANTLNSETVRFWQKQGVKRIVLGRELSLAQVKKIRKTVSDIELELFVHGAMCMSYSGRCLLSKFMTGRSANQGECTHPCRWQYRLKEMQRPDEEFLIEEDSRGTYVMNSKDLCMIEHVQAMIDAGVDSFKIEGRMKSAYYVAIATKIYRKAIDAAPQYDPNWKSELENISHRNYTTGFYLGEDDHENLGDSSYQRKYAFVGVVDGCDPQKQELKVKARNYFAVGDELEIVNPKADEIRKFKVQKAVNQDGLTVQEAHNQNYVSLTYDGKYDVSRFSLLRRKI